MTLKNEGLETANNAEIVIGFDSPEGDKFIKQLKEHEKKTYDIRPNEKVEKSVLMSLDWGTYTRLHIIVKGDNFSPEESFSEWIDVDFCTLTDELC
jgi:hypothetical protein